MPNGLIIFLIVTFLNGVVIEIGRKIRAKEAEEVGVETYSYLWEKSEDTFNANE
jgi:4-hydroxybenzoate polyprenyltransferase